MIGVSFKDAGLTDQLATKNVFTWGSCDSIAETPGSLAVLTVFVSCIDAISTENVQKLEQNGIVGA